MENDQVSRQFAPPSGKRILWIIEVSVIGNKLGTL